MHLKRTPDWREYDNLYTGGRSDSIPMSRDMGSHWGPVGIQQVLLGDAPERFKSQYV